MSEVRIRPATAADAEEIAHVHFAAVHGTASAFYPLDVLDDWSPQPDEMRYEQLRQAIAKAEELLLVAEEDSHVVGFGCILPARQELRAVYVDPGVARRGVGAMILEWLEKTAIERGIEQLQLDASLNAEPFYRRHGYETIGRGVHRLRTGREIACVNMRKALTTRRS